MKLFRKRVRLGIAKYSFGNRVCDQGNKWPAALVSFQGRKYIQKQVRNIPEENGGDLNKLMNFVRVKPLVGSPEVSLPTEPSKSFWQNPI